MTDKNLSTNNNQNQDITIGDEYSNLQESTDENSASQNLPDYEINTELDELRNKIRLEIAKREQSNLKHNIFYIPSLENTHLHIENIYEGRSEIENGKAMPIILKSLLKNKLSVTEAIHKLTCVEDILRCKINFRENLDSIALDLKANRKDFDDANIVFYRQQWRKVATELNELKNVQTALDLKIKSLMLGTNVSPNDSEFLKHTIQLKTCQCDFLVKHINHIKEVFREEIKVKNKFIHIMAQMLEMSNGVLRRNSLLTQQMSDSYCNMIRTAQGLGINNLIVGEISNVQK